MNIIRLIPIFLLYGLHAQSTFKVRLNGEGQFIDNEGRVRIFHGFNSVMKRFPWFDPQILNDTRLALYRDWGFNLVRLGTMWAGLQPTKTQYNSTYIATLLEIVAKLQKNGMHSLLDMHQDVLSSKFKSYDGVPLWLVNEFPAVPDEFKFPFPLNSNISHFWGDYYISYAASDAFQSLYSTEVGIEAWVSIWGTIATIFRDQNAIIGYELLNEPWVGNPFKDIRRLLPGFAGRTNLLPAYDKIVAQIRRNDNQTLIFYEPVTFGSYVPTTGILGTGFDRVPGGEAQKSKSVLSYHFYCFFLVTANPWENYQSWMRTLCDDFFGKQLFESVSKNLKITGGGSLLTEFGGCEPDGNELSINTIECEAVMSLADSYFQSYTYWDSQFFNGDGSTKQSVVRTFARAYPRAIQGQPVKYSFDRISRTMNFTFVIDITIGAPTEIFIPMKVHYVTGFKNQTIPEMQTRFDTNTFIFYVSPPSNIKQGTEISVKITP